MKTDTEKPKTEKIHSNTKTVLQSKTDTEILKEWVIKNDDDEGNYSELIDKQTGYRKSLIELVAQARAEGKKEGLILGQGLAPDVAFRKLSKKGKALAICPEHKGNYKQEVIISKKEIYFPNCYCRYLKCVKGVADGQTKLKEELKALKLYFDNCMLNVEKNAYFRGKSDLKKRFFTVIQEKCDFDEVVYSQIEYAMEKAIAESERK